LENISLTRKRIGKGIDRTSRGRRRPRRKNSSQAEKWLRSSRLDLFIVQARRGRAPWENHKKENRTPYRGRRSPELKQSRGLEAREGNGKNIRLGPLAFERKEGGAQRPGNSGL